MRLKQGGFGLMEVMVSVGLTGVLSYIVMQQSDMSSKQQAKASYNQALNTLTTSIQAELAKSENCTATLRNMAYGTMANPTVVSVIRKGIVNTGITNGPVLFQTRKVGSVGIYIDQMGLMIRPLDNKKVLRVLFKPGDITGTGLIREKSQIGGKSISKDFLISATDNGSLIQSCQSESTNLLSSACASLPGGVWKDTTKKCEVSGIVTDDDLIPLWSIPAGGISAVKPPDVVTSRVECRKSLKRCSRTNSDCSLPACPASHIRSSPWEEDRDEGPLNQKCMKYANCIFQSSQVGWMVKP